MSPTKGLRFHHARALDENNQPMVYVVTKIARGTVYYRPVDGGSPDCCDEQDFNRYCRSAA
jgi:hypothetical protein